MCVVFQYSIFLFAAVPIDHKCIMLDTQKVKRSQYFTTINSIKGEVKVF